MTIQNIIRQKTRLSLFKVILLTLSVLAATIMLTGCKKTVYREITDTKKNIELDFWNVFTGPDGEFMQKIIDDFNKKYRGEIKVNTRVIASEDYYTTLLSAMIGRIAPDVCILHCSRIAYFADKKLLFPMKEIVSNLKIKDDEFIEIAWKAGKYKGSRYGIPLDIHPLGLYYNKKLLYNAGFQKSPRDLNEFLEMAKSCTYDSNNDGNIDIWGFAIDPNVMSGQIFWSILCQYGGQIFTDDKMTSAYNSGEGIKSIQLLYDMIYKYKISPKGLIPDGAATMFEEGKLLFYINGSWMIPEFTKVKELDFGTSALPKFGEKNDVWADSHNIVVPAQREIDSGKLKAIEKVVRYLLEHSDEWAAAGHVPVLKKILKNDTFKKFNYIKPFAEQLSYVSLPYGSPYYDDIWSPVQEHLPEVLLNNIRPENMLINAENEAKSRIMAR